MTDMKQAAPAASTTPSAASPPKPQASNNEATKTDPIVKPEPVPVSKS